MAKTITVAGEGVWSVDNTGLATFTPEDDFFGDPTPIKYTVQDTEGTLSNQAQINVTYDRENMLVAAGGEPVVDANGNIVYFTQG